ncbi:MAG: hypothetical protein JXR63_11535 [Spirochaetales bacterium]|nr:hypothetical protein [Spirochaetales bacterium]
MSTKSFSRVIIINSKLGLKKLKTSKPPVSIDNIKKSTKKTTPKVINNILKSY